MNNRSRDQETGAPLAIIDLVVIFSPLLRSVALQALADMRRLTQDLRPRVLDDLGLTAALEWLSDDLEKQCQIKSSFQLAGEKKKPAPEVQLCLFRIAQEALSNIRRHSGATFVKTLLEFEQNKIRLTI